MTCFLSGRFLFPLSLQKGAFFMSSRIDFYLGQRSPRPSSTLPFLSCLLFFSKPCTAPSIFLSSVSSLPARRFRCGYRIPDHADCENLISSLATGTTVLLGQKIGQKKPSEGGKIAGASLILLPHRHCFSLLLTLGAAPLSRAMNAPEAAFLKTVHYLSICGGRRPHHDLL